MLKSIAAILIAISLQLSAYSSEQSKLVDKDFRRYMALQYPKLEQAPVGYKWEPHYSVWIGKHWRDYPGFWNESYGSKTNETNFLNPSCRNYFRLRHTYFNSRKPRCISQ